MSSDAGFALIVDDDQQIRKLLCHLLAADGFEVSAVGCYADALQVLKTQKPDLVLLDLGLPDEDGLALGKWLRANTPSAGIIILSGRSHVAQRVTGLQYADDYITKPFDVHEVRARIHSLMRRVGPTVPTLKDLDNVDILFEGCRLKEDVCALISSNRETPLTRTEFRLLKVLVTHPNRVVTRAWLLDQVDADLEINERTIDFHICKLRIKLRQAGLRDGIIASVRGFGYRYALPSAGSVDSRGVAV